MMREIKGEKMGGEIAKPMSESSMLMFPHFSIDTEHLPEAKDWEVGKVYDVVLRVKQTGISMHQHDGSKERGNADFDIVGIEPKGMVKNKKEVKRYASHD